MTDPIVQSEASGLIADLFKLFFSDHNVIIVIITSIVMVALLITIMDLVRRRFY